MTGSFDLVNSQLKYLYDFFLLPKSGRTRLVSHGSEMPPKLAEQVPLGVKLIEY